MAAPEEFAQWLAQHEHCDPTYGWVYQYHPRSDAHSVALCRFILSDLLEACQALKEMATAGTVVYGINYPYPFPLSKKTKTLDLAIGVGTPDTAAESVAGIYRGEIHSLQLSCELKTVMTEHSKSQPRIFDELSSSHEIVHNGEGQKAIAAGVAVVNVAETFVSPLRQKSATLHVTKHKQPEAAERMIAHLRGLPIRGVMKGVGFDAFASLVVNCDNQEPATLHTDFPSPQPGDADHYDSFLESISAAYQDRFGE